MNLKGNQRGGARELAEHLLNVTENEHIEVHEVRGFMSVDLEQALEEIHAINRGTKCKQPMFSLSFNPPPDKDVPIEIFEKAIEKAEQRLGLEQQPRVVVFHEKKGRRHAHCVWSRIDADKMTAINMPFYKFRLRNLSRELYLEHGWKLPKGLENSQNRNPLNFTLAEWQQAKRHGEDPKAIKTVFQKCWRLTKTDKAFSKELESNGYYLARGDRRGFVAVDWQGEVYSLTKWIGVGSKEMKTRLGDIQSLPSVIETKAKLAKHMTQKLQGFVRESEIANKEISARMVQERTKMAERHREERTVLYTRLEKRTQEENKIRVARFPSGIRIVWSVITGQYWAIRRRNEAEAAQCLAQDRAERQTLIGRQLKERSKLQQQMTVWLEQHWQKTALFKQDIAYYLSMDVQKDLRDRAAVTRVAPEHVPLRPSNSTRNDLNEHRYGATDRDL